MNPWGLLWATHPTIYKIVCIAMMVGMAALWSALPDFDDR